MRSWSLSYRRDIDGLRALAVLSVFLFHLNPSWLRGGFVGVDIFFVISGYLITSILMKIISTGEGSFLEFYQRRIARLLPASSLVICATLASSAAIYSSQDLASAGINSAFVVLFVANIKFYLQGSYFEISPDAQPFLHFWSLAVEEQYYLVTPFLLAILFRLRRRWLFPALVVATAVSFGLCVYVTPIDSNAAFYLLPFRAWELGVGACIAFLPKPERVPRWAANIVGLSGFIFIILSVILISEQVPFPGYAAAFPVAGTGLLLIAGSIGKYHGERILSSGPMVSIGKISYSLYIWHWPVFSFIDYSIFDWSENIRFILKILISFSAAYLTYIFLEVPARKLFNKKKMRVAAFAFLGATVLVVVPLGVEIRTENYINASLSQIEDGGIEFLSNEGAPTVLLVGDSHGSMYSVMLRNLSRDLGYNYVVASAAAGDALPSLKGSDSALWAAQEALIANMRPDFLVVSNEWTEKLQYEDGRLSEFIRRVEDEVGQVILLNQPPHLPPQASRQGVRNGAMAPFYEVEEYETSRRRVNAELGALASDHIVVLDVSSAFLTEENSIIFADGSGRLLYQDDDHLSGLGADRIRPLLENVLVK